MKGYAKLQLIDTTTGAITHTNAFLNTEPRGRKRNLFTNGFTMTSNDAHLAFARLPLTANAFRLYHYLCGRTTYHQRTLPLSQRHVGKELDISPVEINRAFRQLINHKLIFKTEIDGLTHYAVNAEFTYTGEPDKHLSAIIDQKKNTAQLQLVSAKR